MKQVIVMRKDLNMRKGKMAAQAAHASMKVVAEKMVKAEGRFISDYGISDGGFHCFIPKGTPLYDWLNGIFKKVVVGVSNEDELLEIYARAKKHDILTALITDSGATEFHGVPTNTCIAVGPDTEEKIDSITGHLQLL